MPGAVRVEMERQGVIKDDYYVLELGVTAEKKMVAENLTNNDAAHQLQLFLTQTASHKESDP